MIIITTTVLFKCQGQSQLLPSPTSTVHRSKRVARRAQRLQYGLEAWRFVVRL